jgi:hypothetical protein
MPALVPMYTRNGINALRWHERASQPKLWLSSRVARWHIFKPKIPIWVNFGGPCNGRCWYIICPFGLFHDYTVYFVAIWYILWLFDIYFPRFGMLYQ